MKMSYNYLLILALTATTSWGIGPVYFVNNTGQPIEIQTKEYKDHSFITKGNQLYSKKVELANGLISDTINFDLLPGTEKEIMEMGQNYKTSNSAYEITYSYKGATYGTATYKISLGEVTLDYFKCKQKPILIQFYTEKYLKGYLGSSVNYRVTCYDESLGIKPKTVAWILYHE